MNDKIGRNDPCYCGSGKKYKHCHMQGEAAPFAPFAPAPAPAPATAAQRLHEGAVPMSLNWLTTHHRKGFKTAVENLFEILWPDDGPEDRRSLSEVEMNAVQINLTEWLMAEGDMLVKREHREVNQLLCGPDGPALSDGQRQWLLQLAARPLRLYTVTDVRVGDGLTLCDALDGEAPPLLVQERMGSRSAKPGMLIGCRVMTVDGHLELSGAMYPFSLLAQAAARAAVQDQNYPGQLAEDLPYAQGLAIARAWLRQYAMPLPIPKMVDTYSGEALLLITDHYRVLDASALAAALAAHEDVSGDATQGWRREIDCDDGMVRSLVAINPGKKADRIELFYRTQSRADQGRPWFDALAGAAVAYLTREISDPRAVMAKATPATRDAAALRKPPGLSPEALADAIEQVLRQTYARWADEPIAALDDQTPRQAMHTPTGLERVKGLLRSYESGEVEMAARDGRRAISYQFLWDKLALSR